MNTLRGWVAKGYTTRAQRFFNSFGPSAAVTNDTDVAVTTSTFANLSLLYVPLDVGTYVIDAYLDMNVGAGQAKFQFGSTGGLTVSSATSIATVTDLSSATIVLASRTTGINTSMGNTVGASADCLALIRATITVSVAGLLKIMGAQATTNAAATTFRAGSSMTATAITNLE